MRPRQQRSYGMQAECRQAEVVAGRNADMLVCRHEAGTLMVGSGRRANLLVCRHNHVSLSTKITWYAGSRQAGGLTGWWWAGGRSIDGWHRIGLEVVGGAGSKGAGV